MDSLREAGQEQGRIFILSLSDLSYLTIIDMDMGVFLHALNKASDHVIEPPGARVIRLVHPLRFSMWYQRLDYVGPGCVSNRHGLKLLARCGLSRQE